MFLLFCLCSTVFLSAAQSVPLPATGKRFKRKITEDFNSGQEVFPDVSIADEIIRANQADDIDLFEGDIVLAATHHSQPAKRSAPRHRASLWLTKKIPYEMDASLTDTLLATNIAIAIGEFNNLTCVQWEPRRTEVNWVRFVQTNGCWSAVGRQYWQKGAQEVSLSRGCSNPGAILHEMMHAIGLWHEQSRPDRDQHVEVMWENILPGKEQNFEKYRHDRVDAMGLRYDFNSLLHYGNRAFGANGKQTLQALGNPLRPLGGQSRPSQGDVIKIDTLYDCKGPKDGWSSWTAFSPCDSACNKHRQRFCTSESRDTSCPGADRHGVQTEALECAHQDCHVPLDGHWGRWSSWSSCSVSCDLGVRTRTRSCDDPVPSDEGLPCVGNASDHRSCVTRFCDADTADCTFDENWCHWSNDNTGSSPFPWKRSSEGTPTSGTGPSKDHTSGLGSFVYAESSSPVRHGQTTRLISQAFQATSATCLSFFYHMYGDGIGGLEVYLVNSSRTMAIVWTRRGNHGNQWLQGLVDIKSSDTYQVMFEAIRGTSYYGDIALDDVTFRNGDCNCPLQKQQLRMRQPSHDITFSWNPPLLSRKA